ncbi:MAG TPA: hypothetical protein VML96_13475 [Egibacteraceae bacterium]|nr:hypothetical protein [Egibacteraceae bacterium]
MSKIPDVQQAVRDLEGVAFAAVRWPDPKGPATLRVEFAEGADREQVTREVLDTLREVGGVDLETMEIRIPEPPPEGHREGHPRPVFTGMSVDRRELDSAVEVTLTFNGRHVTGHASGLATWQEGPRTAAAAALLALREFLPSSVRVQLEWLEVVEGSAWGRPKIVQSAVTCLTRQGEEVFVGTAFVVNDVREAAVRATLDALNRRLDRLIAQSS